MRAFDQGQILVVTTQHWDTSERFHCFPIGTTVIVTKVLEPSPKGLERFNCKELGSDNPLFQTLYDRHLATPSSPAGKRALAQKAKS